jgi:oxygen-independent coproporphyrinogen III oxidase
MAGLYIHVPFCSNKCLYCDFYSGNQLYLIDKYIDALIIEITERAVYLNGELLETIYFGGGTPSLLTKNQMRKILNTVFKIFNLASRVEITLECNPEDINSAYVDDLFNLGFNRISLGIQFLDYSILEKFNRKHTKELIFNALDIINRSRFTNLSIDLIYSVPGITDESLANSLAELLEYSIQHVSAYSLTIAKNSQLHWKITSGEFIENQEETFLSQYHIVNSFLKQKGFVQYELSNYAKDGYRSMHNLGYWNQIPYLGVGVSAHSYNLVSRQWNITGVKKYIRALTEGNGIICSGFEELTEIQKYNEYIILKLRTYQGLSLEFVKNTYSDQVNSHFLFNINELLNFGHFMVMDELVIPKESDLLIADFLAKNLMI